MILEYGDMWSAWNTADLFLITTNAVVKNNGALVMGRGIAQQAHDKWPGLDLRLGSAIKDRGYAYPETTPYGLLISPNWPTAKFGIFQVKYHFRDKADLELIRLSVNDLHTWSTVLHPDAQVHLNYPGIGNGHLNKVDIEPLLATLPANVHIWQWRK